MGLLELVSGQPALLQLSAGIEVRFGTLGRAEKAAAFAEHTVDARIVSQI